MTKVPAPRDVLVANSESRLGFSPVRAVLAFLRADRIRSIWPLSLRSRFTPTFDIKERPDVFVVRADLPGVKVGDVEVMLSRKRIVISGKREDEPVAGELPELRYENNRRYGKFSRSLPLPPEVDVSQCQADLRDGVLTLELPKTSEAVMRKISVKSERARP